MRRPPDLTTIRSSRPPTGVSARNSPVDANGESWTRVNVAASGGSASAAVFDWLVWFFFSVGFSGVASYSRKASERRVGSFIGR